MEDRCLFDEVTFEVNSFASYRDFNHRGLSSDYSLRNMWRVQPDHFIVSGTYSKRELMDDGVKDNTLAGQQWQVEFVPLACATSVLQATVPNGDVRMYCSFATKAPFKQHAPYVIIFSKRTREFAFYAVHAVTGFCEAAPCNTWSPVPTGSQCLLKPSWLVNEM